VVDKDSSVKLQASPPKGGEESEHEESSTPVISYADSLNQHSNDTEHPNGTNTFLKAFLWIILSLF
jgi:hypothetical protein